MSVKLWTSLIWPGCAMGKYSIKAKGFLFAVLRWGDKTGALPDWSPIAYVPIDPAETESSSFPADGRSLMALLMCGRNVLLSDDAQSRP